MSARLSMEFQRAQGLHQRGRLAEARLCYEKILRAQPKHFGALHFLGVIAAQSSQAELAVELMASSLLLNQKNAFAYNNYGNALAAVRRYEAAIEHFDKAIALDNRYADAYYNRGIAQFECQQYSAAIASYSASIALNGQQPEAFYNRGNVEYRVERYEEALSSYDRALALKNEYADCHCQRGNTLWRLGRWDDALGSYDRAIELQPSFAAAHSNRANVLRDLGRFDAAMASYDCAIRLNPQFVHAYSNRGNVLKDLRQFDAARESYARAIELDADYAEAYYNRAITSLLMGDLDRGWVDYEWRWKNENFPNFRNQRQFAQPRWRGLESLAGKTILLYSEQGLGDSLQFCRYTKMVADLGASVVLEVPGPLISLFSELEGVTRLVERGTELPEFDYHCPLLSLPLAFKTNLDRIPSPGRYLRANQNCVSRWHRELGDMRRPLIGLVWSGSEAHPNDRNRSVPLSQLLAFLPDNATYVCLQKEIRAADRLTLQESPRILDVSSRLSDFGETSALCECMDLVISVDTSVAHLNAALDKETWILLPHMPDWRWLLDGDRSPWYSAARLYRQTQAGNWDDVLRRIRSDLVRQQASTAGG